MPAPDHKHTPSDLLLLLCCEAPVFEGWFRGWKKTGVACPCLSLDPSKVTTFSHEYSMDYDK